MAVCICKFSFKPEQTSDEDCSIRYWTVTMCQGCWIAIPPSPILANQTKGEDYAHRITTCPPPPDFKTFLRPCVPMRTKRDRQNESIYIEMCMHTCDFLPTFNLVIARVTPCRAVQCCSVLRLLNFSPLGIRPNHL